MSSEIERASDFSPETQAILLRENLANEDRTGANVLSGFPDQPIEATVRRFFHNLVESDKLLRMANHPDESKRTMNTFDTLLNTGEQFSAIFKEVTAHLAQAQKKRKTGASFRT